MKLINYSICLLIIISLVTCKNLDDQGQGTVIDSDFPGGNIIVDNSDNISTLYHRVMSDTVLLRPDIRDTQGDWFYWYFRVSDAAGRRMIFKFPQGNAFGVYGPAVSADSGRTWRWLGDTAINATSFYYTFPADAKETRFSMGMPYVESNLHEFLNRYKENPNLDVSVLCKTKKGREVEKLRFGRIDGKANHKIFITCRHHACEMIANYCLEGIIESVLADTDDGKWFCEQVEFLAIPFVDKDGVQDGDQGKNRKPHDYAEDYNIEESIYPSVRAIKELIPEWSQERLRFSLDIHCPGLRGEYHEVLLFPSRLRGNENWKNVEKFLKCLDSIQKGPLPFSLNNSLSFTSWDGNTNVVIPNTPSRWVREIPGVLFGTSLEIPYANASGKAVTVENTRDFGHDLASAIRFFLETENDKIIVLQHK